MLCHYPLNTGNQQVFRPGVSDVGHLQLVGPRGRQSSSAPRPEPSGNMASKERLHRDLRQGGAGVGDQTT